MDQDAMLVVSEAVAAGAAAGLKDTAAKAVVDAYAILKSLLSSRYRNVDVSAVEKKPDSRVKRESLAEDLVDAGAEEDQELLESARRLLVAVTAGASDIGAAIGVDLDRVDAASLRIQDVISEGTGTRARDVKVAGDIDIRRVQAGATTGEPLDPSRR